MLVDTSVWIDYLNGYASPQADSLARAISEDADIYLCGLVLTEILLRLPQSEALQLEVWLAAFLLVPELEREDYQAAAQLYRACRAKGMIIRSTINCLIAQLCLKHDYILLAKDRDFIKITRCFPLRLYS